MREEGSRRGEMVKEPNGTQEVATEDEGVREKKPMGTTMKCPMIMERGPLNLSRMRIRERPRKFRKITNFMSAVDQIDSCRGAGGNPA